MALQDDIKKLRVDKGYTQSEMADILHVSRSTLSKWETGNAIPSANDLQKMKNEFHISIDYLLDDKEKASIDSDRERNDLKTHGLCLVLLSMILALSIVKLLFDSSTILTLLGNYLPVDLSAILGVASDLAISVVITLWIYKLLRNQNDNKNAIVTVITFYVCSIICTIYELYFVNSIQLAAIQFYVFTILRWIVLPIVCMVSIVLFYKNDEWTNPAVVILICGTKLLDNIYGVMKTVYSNRNRLLFFDYNSVSVTVDSLSVMFLLILFLHYALVLMKERKVRNKMQKNNWGGAIRSLKKHL